MLEQKRKNIRLGHPTKSGWIAIVGKHGKHKKVKEEERVKILDWVRAHPNVVNSPIARDTIICPDPTPEDPRRTAVRKNKLLLQCSVGELHSD